MLLAMRGGAVRLGIPIQFCYFTHSLVGQEQMLPRAVMRTEFSMERSP